MVMLIHFVNLIILMFFKSHIENIPYMLVIKFCYISLPIVYLLSQEGLNFSALYNIDIHGLSVSMAKQNKQQ